MSLIVRLFFVLFAYLLATLYQETGMLLFICVSAMFLLFAVVETILQWFPVIDWVEDYRTKNQK